MITKIGATSNNIEKLFLGDVDQQKMISTALKELFATIPIFSTDRLGGKYASEYFKVNLCHSEIVPLLNESVKVLHSQLQTLILDDLQSITNGGVEISIDGEGDHLEARVDVYPFDSRYTYKMPYLLEQLKAAKSQAGFMTTRDLPTQNELNYEMLFETYVALRNVASRAWISSHEPVKANLYNEQYLSEDNPRYFKSKRDVLLFFKALILSPYDFIFDGHYVTDNKDVVKIFTYNEYFMHPCRACDDERIGGGIAESTMKRANEQNPEANIADRLIELRLEIIALAQSDFKSQLLPHELKFLR